MAPSLCCGLRGFTEHLVLRGLPFPSLNVLSPPPPAVCLLYLINRVLTWCICAQTHDHMLISDRELPALIPRLPGFSILQSLKCLGYGIRGDRAEDMAVHVCQTHVLPLLPVLGLKPLVWSMCYSLSPRMAVCGNKLLSLCVCTLTTTDSTNQLLQGDINT